MQRVLRNLFLMMPLLLGQADMASADAIYTGFFNNKAVGGYDSVAYFTEGKPIKGSGQFKHRWMGADWYFSSAANQKKFRERPEYFAPQYGGYCAWAVAAKSELYEGNPHYWKIVDEKLYLNYDKSVQQRWLKDIPGFITKGDKHWPALKHNQ